MSLPEGFIFSQGKIQDYLDCQRQFQLRYLLNRSWPALLADPIEEYELMTLLGQKFHHMIRQYFLGISQVRISQMIRDDKLGSWWNSFLHLKSDPREMEFIWREQAKNYTEVSITTTLANFQITAKYDLISITPGKKIVIVDWKTSIKNPSHSLLKDRMQTKIYPYLLVKVGSFINRGVSIDPDTVEMIYWFANFPDHTQKFGFSNQQHLANEDYLVKLIDEISQKQDNDFELTSHSTTCRFCVYRSLCERGDLAGDIKDFTFFSEPYDDISEPKLKIEDISEIAF